MKQRGGRGEKRHGDKGGGMGRRCTAHSKALGMPAHGVHSAPPRRHAPVAQLDEAPHIVEAQPGQEAGVLLGAPAPRGTRRARGAAGRGRATVPRLLLLRQAVELVGLLPAGAQPGGQAAARPAHGSSRRSKGSLLRCNVQGSKGMAGASVPIWHKQQLQRAHRAHQLRCWWRCSASSCNATSSKSSSISKAARPWPPAMAAPHVPRTAVLLQAAGRRRGGGTCSPPTKAPGASLRQGNAGAIHCAPEGAALLQGLWRVLDHTAVQGAERRPAAQCPMRRSSTCGANC